MVTRRYYIGSSGPYYYDDEAPLRDGSAMSLETDEDVEDSELFQNTIVTKGQIKVATPPSEDNHTLRKVDLTSGLISALTLINNGHTATFVLSSDGILSLTLDGIEVQTWP
ncbi:hypothetical protein KKH23_08115 [Patescibacteria group bacterium]|nr:hypothetical protein [Patescibacteria group bacterium]